MPQDRGGVAHVGLDVVRGALGAADEQRLRVTQHDRVVVDVHDPRLGDHALHYLMEVRLGGDAGADVEELGHALIREPGGGAVHEGAVLPGGVLRLGREFAPDGLVDRVVVLAAQQPVVDARGWALLVSVRGGVGVCPSA